MVSRDTDGDNAEVTALIQAIYQVAVDPHGYDQLVELWGKYLSDGLAKGGGEQGVDLVSSEVSSHLLRSFEILDRLGRTEITSEAHLSDQKIELKVDSAGQIFSCNEMASEVLGCRIGLSVFELAMSPESANRLVEYLSGRGSNRSEEVFVFFDESDGTPCPIVGSQQEDGRKLLLAGLHQKWTPSHDQVLQKLFGLTMAEARLARDLLGGASMRDVADRTGRSVDTLRTQLKAVRRKTYTSNQQQLVRIMTGLETLAYPNGLRNEKTPEQDHVVSLPDGRRMYYRVIGPTRGMPCLFIHNMLNEPEFSFLGIHEIHRRGLRMICPIRPSFGASDKDPVCIAHPAQAPDRFIQDAMHLLQHLGIPRVVAVGHMSGALYAFRFAQLQPETVAGVFNISGGVPIRELSQIHAMNSRQKIMALTARFTPSMLPAILRAGIAQIDAGGVDAFLNALYKEGTPDRLVAERPEHRNLLHQGFRQTVAQGHWGFAIDAHHMVRNWSKFCDGVQQPVMLMHGEHDPVVSARSVRKFGDQMGFNYTIMNDAGQLVLYQNAEETLRLLSELAGRVLGRRNSSCKRT